MANNVYQGLWTMEQNSLVKPWIWTVDSNLALVIGVLIGIGVFYLGEKLWILVKTLTVQGILLIDHPETRPETRPSGSSGNVPEPHGAVELGALGSSGNAIGSSRNGNPENIQSPQNIDVPENTAEADNIGNPHQEEAARNLQDPEEAPRNLRDPEEVPQNLRDKDFSAIDAIQAFLNIGEDKPKVQMLRGAYEHNRVLLGKMAMLGFLILLITIVFAPFIPYMMTGFGTVKPIVRSVATDSCGLPNINRSVLEDKKTHKNRKAEHQFLDCYANLDQQLAGCETDLWLKAFPPLVATKTHCPFMPEFCVDSSEALRLEHRLSLADVGYNSPSKLQFEQTLDCMPLPLDNMISRLGPSLRSKAGVGFLDPHSDFQRTVEVAQNYIVLLNTLNGPNKLSSDFSGWDGNTEDPKHSGAMAITLIPTLRSPNRMHEMYRHLIPKSARSDGSVFNILFSAERTMFQGPETGPIRDPIFKSTRRLENNTIFYVPDQEITALGCVERFRFCLPGDDEAEAPEDKSICTTWIGFHQELWDFIYNNLTDNSSAVSPKLASEFSTYGGVGGIFSILFIRASVEQYLRENTHFILTEARRNNFRVTLLDSSKQWELEMKALFQTALLNGRLTLHDIIARKQKAVSNTFNGPYPEFCNGLLFYDSAYTNINFHGFMIMVVVVLIAVVYDVCRLAEWLRRKLKLRMEERRRQGGHLTSSSAWSKARMLIQIVAELLGLGDVTFGYGLGYVTHIFQRQFGSQRNAPP